MKLWGRAFWNIPISSNPVKDINLRRSHKTKFETKLDQVTSTGFELTTT